MSVAADAALVVQAGIVLAILEGLRRRHVPAVVNAALALGASLTPAAVGLLVGRGPGLPAEAELTLWIATAGLLHALGMLGFYDALAWWDHLTHGVSAGLLTALAYGGALVLAAAGLLGPAASVGPAGVALGLLLVLSALWELLEELARYVADRRGIRPILVIYGPYDAAFDLAFNLVGAGLVLLLDLRLFVPTFEPYPAATAELFAVVGGLGLVLGAALAVALASLREDWP